MAFIQTQQIASLAFTMRLSKRSAYSHTSCMISISVFAPSNPRTPRFPQPPAYAWQART